MTSSLQVPSIYAITDDKLLVGDKLFDAAEQALSAGISMLQYRSKLTSEDEKRSNAAVLATLCDKYQVPLIINDDVELCRRVNAAGVHLSLQDRQMRTARNRLGSDAIIGISCHASVEDAISAENFGVDYVAFGQFFPSSTNPDASLAELQLLTEAKSAVNIPIVAIGGINAQNGADIFEAGADILAVIEGIFDGPNVTERTHALIDLYSNEFSDEVE